MLSFFPRGVLDEILNLIESVSEGFPSYSSTEAKVDRHVYAFTERNKPMNTDVLVTKLQCSRTRFRNRDQPSPIVSNRE